MPHRPADMGVHTDADSSLRTPSRLARVALVALAALPLAWAGAHLWRAACAPGLPWMNRDAAICLRYGMSMLDAGRLYIDLPANNPPAIFQLGSGLAYLERLTSAPVIALFHVGILALGALGLLVIDKALGSRHGMLTRSAVLFAYVAVVLAAGSGEYGQRPHIFCTVFLPYVLARLVVARASPALIAYAVPVGFLATMKPYWMLQVVALELAVLVARRTRDGGVRVALVAGSLAPLALLWRHDPQALAAFVTGTVPSSLWGGYATLSADLSAFLLSPQHGWLIVVMGIFALAGLAGRASAAAPTWWIVAVAVLVGIAYVGVIHQRKFWSYHFVPVFAIALWSAAWLAAAATERLRRPGVRAWSGGALALIAAMVAATSSIELAARAGRRQPSVRGLTELAGRHGRIVHLTASFDGYLEIAALRHAIDLVTIGGFNEIGIASHIEDAVERDSKLRDVVAKARESITTLHPALVLVSTSSTFMNGRTVDDFLITTGGLFPHPRYVLVSTDEIKSTCPPLLNYRVYRRL